MNTYTMNGKTYLVHDSKLFVEVEPHEPGVTRDERTTAALKVAVKRTHEKLEEGSRKKRCGVDERQPRTGSRRETRSARSGRRP